ncbi:hypothetical protein M446_4688 [Methylobacterium sp. 4-46]|uniref:hypothetical protein n=1 Tax=unclassified Methylobacterium TaxID=2615210 RepID=UPI000165CC13|nr:MULTISPECIES: hypothetical protein [Methylobacterium]ACA19027.1 hypothetical protein M446_4688 [Methylobacterium sp. 4-46]WFT78241.1 hypothetical protein QA634_23565 [Methylobacterium nodulans]
MSWSTPTSHFQLWLLWPRPDGVGVVTDHQDLGVATREVAVAAAADRACELFSRSEGVVMLLDAAGQLVWSRRSGMKRPGQPSGP